MRSKKYDEWERPEIEDWDDDIDENIRDEEERQFIIVGGGFGCRPRFFGCRPRFFGCRPRFYGCRPRFFGCYPRTFFSCFPRPCYPI